MLCPRPRPAPLCPPPRTHPDFAMDMWSVGCVLYELFTGKILFPGRTNNEMLKLMIDLKGPFTKKMLRRCTFADKHFDMHEPSAPFIYVEEDTISKKLVSSGGTERAPHPPFVSMGSGCKHPQRGVHAQQR